jgi:hypothetical protein
MFTMTVKTFKNLTLCAVLYSVASPALSQDNQNRCIADLQRVQPQNCLSRDKLQHNYDWKLTDNLYGMLTNACIADTSASGTHKDIVIGIDRSNSNSIPDKLRKKLRADSISVTIDLINQLNETYKSNPEKAPNVSLTMFSSQADCREYAGGKISFVGEFPCSYLKAKKVTDEAHKAALLELLAESEGKYSAGSTASASSLDIVANLVKDGSVIASEGRQMGMLVFSTGLSYSGTAADTYAFLKASNYRTAYDTMHAAYSVEAVRKLRLNIVTAPLTKPYYDGSYKDSFENMCALPDRPAADCSEKSNDPANWLVNRTDIANNMAQIAAISGGTAIKSNAAGIAAKLAAELLVQGQTNIVPERAVLLVNGQESTAVSLSGQQISIQNLPSGSPMDLRLEVYANGAMVPFDFKINTSVVPGADTDFTDNEMFCAAESLDPAIVGPSIKDMQGGSGSCGVIGSENSNSKWFFLLMLLPLLIAVRKSFARSSGQAIVVLGALAAAASGEAQAEEKVSGLNSQHYRPVVDGVANTESGQVINPGTYNAGLYGDYANDPVEIGGEKGKRIKGVTDDMVTAHFSGNLGLFSKVSVGFHLPYVHKTDVNREVNGEEVDGGSLGQPSDSAIFAKWGLVSKSSWSLSAMPQVIIPTGNSGYLLGDGTSSYGATIAVSGSSGSLKWASNIGYMHREKALELADDRTATLKITGYSPISFGMDYRLSGIMSLGGSIFGKFHSGEKIDFTKTNPAEWQTIGKLKWTSSLETSLAFGTGIGRGYGSPDYRLVAGISYVPVQGRGTVRQIVAPAKKK